jgi:hypothetical protein
MGKKGIMLLGVFWCLIFRPGPVLAYQLPDTGITKCYDDAGNVITCPSPGQPFYGQDAQYAGPQPAYRDNGDGTVTDLNTGLMWQQGDTQNDSDWNWQCACDYCDRLVLPSGGYSDWRLPNRRELMSIALYGRYDPNIDTTYFPHCHSCFYWSSSTNNNTSYAWAVNFDTGTVRYHYWAEHFYVRCVRGGP